MTYIPGTQQCPPTWRPLTPSYSPSYFYPDQFYRYWYYYQPVIQGMKIIVHLGKTKLDNIHPLLV